MFASWRETRVAVTLASGGKASGEVNQRMRYSKRSGVPGAPWALGHQKAAMLS